MDMMDPNNISNDGSSLHRYYNGGYEEEPSLFQTSFDSTDASNQLQLNSVLQLQQQLQHQQQQQHQHQHLLPIGDNSTNNNVISNSTGAPLQQQIQQILQQQHLAQLVAQQASVSNNPTAFQSPFNNHYLFQQMMNQQQHQQSNNTDHQQQPSSSSQQIPGRSYSIERTGDFLSLAGYYGGDNVTNSSTTTTPTPPQSSSTQPIFSNVNSNNNNNNGFGIFNNSINSPPNSPPLSSTSSNNNNSNNNKSTLHSVLATHGLTLNNLNSLNNGYTMDINMSSQPLPPPPQQQQQPNFQLPNNNNNLSFNMYTTNNNNSSNTTTSSSTNTSSNNNNSNDVEVKRYITHAVQNSSTNHSTSSLLPFNNVNSNNLHSNNNNNNNNTGGGGGYESILGRSTSTLLPPIDMAQLSSSPMSIASMPVNPVSLSSSAGNAFAEGMMGSPSSPSLLGKKPATPRSRRKPPQRNSSQGELIGDDSSSGPVNHLRNQNKKSNSFPTLKKQNVGDGISMASSPSSSSSNPLMDRSEAGMLPSLRAEDHSSSDSSDEMSDSTPPKPTRGGRSKKKQLTIRASNSPAGSPLMFPQTFTPGSSSKSPSHSLLTPTMNGLSMSSGSVGSFSSLNRSTTSLVTNSLGNFDLQDSTGEFPPPPGHISNSQSLSSSSLTTIMNQPDFTRQLKEVLLPVDLEDSNRPPIEDDIRKFKEVVGSINSSLKRDISESLTELAYDASNSMVEYDAPITNSAFRKKLVNYHIFRLLMLPDPTKQVPIPAAVVSSSPLLQPQPPLHQQQLQQVHQQLLHGSNGLPIPTGLPFAPLSLSGGSYSSLDVIAGSGDDLVNMNTNDDTFLSITGEMGLPLNQFDNNNSNTNTSSPIGSNSSPLSPSNQNNNTSNSNTSPKRSIDMIDNSKIIIDDNIKKQQPLSLPTPYLLYNKINHNINNGIDNPIVDSSLDNISRTDNNGNNIDNNNTITSNNSNNNNSNNSSFYHNPYGVSTTQTMTSSPTSSGVGGSLTSSPPPYPSALQQQYFQRKQQLLNQQHQI